MPAVMRAAAAAERAGVPAVAIGGGGFEPMGRAIGRSLGIGHVPIVSYPGVILADDSGTFRKKMRDTVAPAVVDALVEGSGAATAESAGPEREPGPTRDRLLRRPGRGAGALRGARVDRRPADRPADAGPGRPVPRAHRPGRRRGARQSRAGAAGGDGVERRRQRRDGRAARRSTCRCCSASRSAWSTPCSGSRTPGRRPGGSRSWCSPGRSWSGSGSTRAPA